MHVQQEARLAEHVGSEVDRTSGDNRIGAGGLGTTLLEGSRACADSEQWEVTGSRSLDTRNVAQHYHMRNRGAGNQKSGVAKAFLAEDHEENNTTHGPA